MTPSPEPTTSTTSEPTGGRTIADATCLACGCLCDDINVRVDNGKIVEARNACELGRPWFLKGRAPGGPGATIDGRAVARDEAIDRAAEILGRARAPLVLGLTATTVEAQAAAVALADRVGAFVGLGHADEAAPRLRAFARAGSVTATLGEVKNRADVVVFWGVDPVVTHPRHWERYSVEPVGRFVPEGRRGRTVLVADARRTATAERADLFLEVPAATRVEALWVLRALTRGIEVDSEAERAAGVPLATLRDWAGRMKGARYGAFFHGAVPDEPPRGAAEIEAALALVRDLNAHARFVALGLGGPGNPVGAEAVLTWQTGYPLGVDLARGVPRSFLDETPSERLERGEADAALMVADDPSRFLTPTALERLARVPMILIAPEATTSGRSVSVALASATPGIEAAGTVIRSDGIAIPLRPALPTELPTDRDLLRAIADRLGGNDERS